MVTVCCSNSAPTSRGVAAGTGALQNPIPDLSAHPIAKFKLTPKEGGPEGVTGRQALDCLLMLLEGESASSIGLNELILVRLK